MTTTPRPVLSRWIYDASVDVTLVHYSADDCCFIYLVSAASGVGAVTVETDDSGAFRIDGREVALTDADVSVLCFILDYCGQSQGANSMPRVGVTVRVPPAEYADHR